MKERYLGESSGASDIRYLAVEEVEGLHERVMIDTGDRPRRLQFPDKLEMAVYRPQNFAFYEGADVIRQAAVLAVGISEAQAFEKGNKRTAVAAMDTFLRLNGWEYAGDPVAVAVRLDGIAQRLNAIRDENVSRKSGEFMAEVAAFEGWLRARVGPLAAGG